MNLAIAGMAWVTALGAELEPVWERLKRGDVAEVRTLSNPESGVTHPYMPVPPELFESRVRNPRLRRSSAISHLAVTAGLAAIADAGLAQTPELAERTSIVFAISSGGVAYTRRFYEQIVKQGAHSASPLLFPETVYNAPASHLAALLGIDGASYTLVGDSSVGLSAIKFAEQLLETTDIDHCIVVGAEELDWVLCEAYRQWRLSAESEGAGARGRGMILAEAGAALVLAREGRVRIREVHPGVPLFNRRGVPDALDRLFTELLHSSLVDLAVCSANGSYIDKLEAAALARHCPSAVRLSPKRQFGEALGASALLQVIAGALAVTDGTARSALISAVGFNQQASGLVLG